MATVTLIAKMSFPYAGKSLAIGDEFEASASDAHTLKLIGRAIDAPRLRKTSRKDLTAEPDSESVTVDRPKRQYARRDLVPEP